MTQVNIIIEDIPVTTQGQVAKLVKFQGQLDESNVDEKAKIIYQIIEQFPQNLLLLLDFSDLEYMNSKSIGYLTDWYGKVSQGGGQIVVAMAKSNILDILQVVGLTQLVNCYPTMDEAKFALLRPITQPIAEAAPVEPAASTPVTAPPPAHSAPALDAAATTKTPDANQTNPQV